MVQTTTPFRRGPDRRSQSRGGRRGSDIDGAAPLVLMVGDDASIVNQAEAILCKLKFAVSTTTDPNEALRILPNLRPNLIVVTRPHELLLRTAGHCPVVVMPDSLDSLIDDIRYALRVRPIRPEGAPESLDAVAERHGSPHHQDDKERPAER
jgi:hypothetical protein